MPGYPDKLHTHVLSCNSWSAAEKSIYIKKITSSTSKSSSKSQKNVKISSNSDNEES
ncbi:8092_t:CDS:1, partial [Scutellospora calospora]